MWGRARCPRLAQVRGAQLLLLGKLNEATSAERSGLALKPAGLKSIKPLQKQKGNRKPAQEEGIRGSQAGWGSIQLQAGWLSARSPLPSSFGKVQRFRHSCSVPSHSFLHLRRKARADYISSQPAQLCSGTGTPRKGAEVWHHGHTGWGEGNTAHTNTGMQHPKQGPKGAGRVPENNPPTERKSPGKRDVFPGSIPFSQQPGFPLSSGARGFQLLSARSISCRR